MIIKEEGWEVIEEHISSAQFSDDPHQGTCDHTDYQVGSAFIFNI